MMSENIKKIYDASVFGDSFWLKVNKISWWEKILLWFKLTYEVTYGDVTLGIKELRGKLYVVYEK